MTWVGPSAVSGHHGPLPVEQNASWQKKALARSSKGKPSPCVKGKGKCKGLKNQLKTAERKKMQTGKSIAKAFLLLEVRGS